jgi:hypothetical protein
MAYRIFNPQHFNTSVIHLHSPTQIFFPAASEARRSHLFYTPQPGNVNHPTEAPAFSNATLPIGTKPTDHQDWNVKYKLITDYCYRTDNI